MITTGYFFQIFIFYASHQTRAKNCEKFIFHDALSWEKQNKSFAILVVAGGLASVWKTRAMLQHVRVV
jgi:hypothetical protein